MLILVLKRLILNHCREASYMKPAFFSSFGFCLASFVCFSSGRCWSVLFLYACGCSSRSVAGQFCFRSCMLVAVHHGRSLVSFVSDPVCLWMFISVGRSPHMPLGDGWMLQISDILSDYLPVCLPFCLLASLLTHSLIQLPTCPSAYLSPCLLTYLRT